MKKTAYAARFLITKAMEDSGFRARLLAHPKQTIERELGVTIADGNTIHVHENSADVTHLVLPPPGKFSEEERQAAITGRASLAFLKWSIPGFGVTTVISPRISTALRFAPCSSTRTPGFCWAGTFRRYWPIATRKAVS